MAVTERGSTGRRTGPQMGRPKVVPDPWGSILNLHDVAALTGYASSTVADWRSPKRAPSRRPPPYDNPGSAVWHRETIVPWLVSEGLL